ncbi:hypothetical protein [Bacillus infantis]|uniref:hypothetical protein n=1 Tax=Bacillus infantis TaxID=324767 RepID=UPI003CEA4A7F
MSAQKHVLKVQKPSGEEDIFDFDRLFKDAANYNKKADQQDIQYPRGASISRKSSIVKGLFAAKA